MAKGTALGSCYGARLSVSAMAGLSALVLLSGSGCSKGGAPDQTNCVKLTDPQPGDDAPPMRSLYVEMRTPTGAKVTIPLDGTGGAYSGMYAMGACDEQNTYDVERVVLVNFNGDPVAIANRNGSSYVVTYQNGQTDTVTGAGFSNIATTYSATATGPGVTVQSLTASPTMAKQGDVISMQVALSSDQCGIRDSQWWLAPASVGMMTTNPQTIAGGSGSLMLHVPPTADPTTYFVEGMVTLQPSGRKLGIRRNAAGDQTYSIVDLATNQATATMLPVASVVVAANPDADKVAPNVISVTATPMMPVRCGTVNLELHISDDKGVQAGQKVKMWLGTATQPQLYSATVVGSEYLTGMVQVPLDAPAGQWYVYPDVVSDAAGNQARATFMAGKFTLSGPGITMAQPIDAGSFVVPSNTVTALDLGSVGSLDMAGQMPPDMANNLPAVLNAITVSPSSITMAGAMLTVNVSWTDNAHVLK